ncbi:MAG: glycosyltransferase family 2 protein, partial [Elusimicrobiota bacterium]|nr:glycosyltransferase family 2 protein [Elusimicrobiota bacterium]
MLIFIIPIYNESENIPILLSKIKKLMEDKSFRYKIIAVNDGSTDNSLYIIQEQSKHIPIKICNHTANWGPGKAFLTGFTAALEIANDDDVIVTLESDNTSDLTILPEMISKLNNGNDVVLASCYASGGKVLNTIFYRRFISWSAN